MTISSEIAALNAEVARFYNSLATFTPLVGDAVSLRCELTRSMSPQPSGYEGMVWEQQSTIEALLEDLPHQPNKGETFTISGTTYTVKSIIDDDGYFVKAIVK